MKLVCSRCTNHKARDFKLIWDWDDDVSELLPDYESRIIHRVYECLHCKFHIEVYENKDA